MVVVAVPPRLPFRRRNLHVVIGVDLIEMRDQRRRSLELFLRDVAIPVCVLVVPGCIAGHRAAPCRLSLLGRRGITG